MPLIRAEKILAIVGLPTEIYSLLADLLHRTRLPRRKESDIAAELVSHFQIASWWKEYSPEPFFPPATRSKGNWLLYPHPD